MNGLVLYGIHEMQPDYLMPSVYRHHTLLKETRGAIFGMHLTPQRIDRRAIRIDSRQHNTCMICNKSSAYIMHIYWMVLIFFFLDICIVSNVECG